MASEQAREDAIQREIARIGARVCNWGRWGEDDQLGTLNYITPATIRRGAALVRLGEVCELGVPFEANGPQTGNQNPMRFNALHFMVRVPTEPPMPGGASVSDDVVVMPLQTSTQWDSLAHVAHNGRLYGDRPVSAVTVGGASTNSIRAISSRVVTRGVLADVARHFGVDSLPSGAPISATDLDAVLSAQAVSVEEGDALLVRTGFLERCRSAQWEGWRGPAPGLDLSTLEWLHEHRIAAVATDTTGVEVKPSALEGAMIPFHAVAIPYMGLLMGEIFDLERLSQLCLREERYEFQFVAPPLPVTGAVGSPINPYAIL